MTDSLPPPPSGIPWDLELDEDGVRARLEWARRQGHPRHLWPEVAPGALRGGLRELETVARAALLDRPVRLDAASEADVRALGVAGFTSGLGSLVGRWIEDGRVATGELPARLFAHHLAHGRARATRLAELLERALAGLAGAGVEPTLLKSGHTARVYFPEPGVRPSVDLDLLVDPDRFVAAEEALADAGFERAGAQTRPRKSDWAAPGIRRYPGSLELLHAGGQYAVDLHASLARNFHGVRTVDPGDQDPPTIPATFVDGDARILGQPALLAFHALHASEGLEHLTLIRLVEMVEMIRQDRASGALEWGGLEAFLNGVGGLGFAYPAFLLTERLVADTVDPDFLARSAEAAPRRMRAVLEDVGPGDAQRFDVLSLRERFMWCDSAADVVRRLAHMLVPAPAAGSARRLARVYADRGMRLFRGRVTVERPQR